MIAPTMRCNGDAHSGFKDEAGLVAHTLRAVGHDASEDGTGRGTPLVITPPHPAMNNPTLYRTNAAGQVDDQGDKSAALTSQTDPCTQILSVPKIGVRRLMPVECEILQGFPRLHTLNGIDSKGREIKLSDSARYFVCGNAVTSTVGEWIGRGIPLK